MRLIRHIKPPWKMWSAKKRLYFQLLLGAMLVVLVPLVLITLQRPDKVMASWYDDNWAFRQAVTVTVSSSSSDISNLETLITVNTSSLISSKLQSSCQDLRFTNQAGKLLPYYIDSGCNTTATKIWVLADLVPKNTTTYTMYMYYGNPAAPAASDANKFNLFNGLVGYWNMNESSWTNDCSTATVKDSSVNSNTGKSCPASTGPTGGIAGKYSNGGSFDGSDDTVSIANANSLNFGTGDFTASFWLNVTSPLSADTEYGIVNKNSTFKASAGWGIEVSTWGGSTSTYTVIFYNTGQSTWGNTNASATGGSLSTNQWYYITATRQSTTNTIYVNGSSAGSKTHTDVGLNVDNILPITIADHSWGPNLPAKIDDVRLYNRALSSAEVSQLYNNPGTIATTANATVKPTTSFASEEKAPGPVAYWKFDDGTGTTAQDATTNNNDGTLSGTTKPTWQTEDQCVAGKCLYFDGINGTVDVTDNAGLRPSAFTLSAWIKGNTFSTPNREIIAMSNNDAEILVDTSSKLVGRVWNTSYTAVTGTTTISTNVWHHVELSYNGTTFSIYLDGKLEGTSSSVTVSWEASPTSVHIGSRQATGNYFQGFIDEPKIYNYARTAAQILADYNSRGSSKGASGRLNLPEGSTLSNGLVGYWKMDEASWNGTSGEVVDSSGNSKNGTSAGSATTAAGKFGNGGSFNGSTGYVSASPASATDWTISGWGKASSLSNTRNTIFGFNCYGCMNFKIQSTYIEVTADGNGYVDNAAIFYTTNANTWYHYAISCNSSSNKATVYVNGTQVFYGNDSNFGCAQLGGGGSEFRIGLSRTASEAYAGTVDEVRIYNRALSSAEVSQLYNFAPGPVGYWNFEEGSGTSVSDRSTQGNTGTWNGTGATHWKTGKYGKSGNFNGSDDYVSVADNDSIEMRTHDLSFSFWVKTSANATQQILSKRTMASGDYDGYSSALIAGGTVNAALTISSTDYVATSTKTINDGNWHFISAVYNRSGNLILYIDGQSNATTSISAVSATDVDTTQPLNIGRRKTANVNDLYFSGQLDDVRIYNYARSAKQINEDMLAGGDSLSNARGVSSSSPVGYWKLDEGYGTTTNNSGSGGSALNGTLTLMASPATSTSGWTQSGKFGKALVFDGINDYVQVSDNNALDMSGGVAISAWINLGETPGASLRTILAKDGTWSGTSTNYQLDIRSSGKIEFAYRGSDSSANEYITNSAVITSGSTWYHVVLTYDGTNNPTIYVNGNAQAGAYSSGGNKAITGNAQPLFIGVLGSSGSPSTNYFIGTLDEVKIYNYALTADEVKLDYNRSSSLVLGSLSDNSTYQVNAANQEYCIPGDSTSCAAPVGRWDFEEGSGTSARDTSGNAYTGTLTNGPTWISGKYGKGLNFDGSDDSISTADIDITGGVTIEAWVKTSSTNSQIVVRKTNSYELIIINSSDCAGAVNGSVSLITGTGTTWSCTNSIYFADGTTSVADGKWHHIAGTFDDASDTMRIYVDGILQTTNTGATGTFGTNNNTTYIGRDVDGSAFPFNGSIDQIRLYNYARTAAQVAWDYNRGGPVGWWKMDECQGDKTNDSSGNSNTGTITATSTLGTCNTASTFWGGSGGTGAGKFNYAPTFNGTGDYIDAGGASSLNITTAITITAWIKTSNNTQAQTIIEKTNTTNPWNGYAVNLGSNDSVVCGGYGYLSYWSGNYPTYSWTCSNSSNYNNGNWHHIAIVHSGTTVTFYKDAVSDGTATVGSRTNNSSTNLFIGQNSLSSRRFSGQLDDVRIFNYALTATQVKNEYNGGSVRFGPSTGSP